MEPSKSDHDQSEPSKSGHDQSEPIEFVIDPYNTTFNLL